LHERDVHNKIFESTLVPHVDYDTDDEVGEGDNLVEPIRRSTACKFHPQPIASSSSVTLDASDATSDSPQTRLASNTTGASPQTRLASNAPDASDASHTTPQSQPLTSSSHPLLIASNPPSNQLELLHNHQRAQSDPTNGGATRDIPNIPFVQTHPMGKEMFLPLASGSGFYIHRQTERTRVPKEGNVNWTGELSEPLLTGNDQTQLDNSLIMNMPDVSQLQTRTPKLYLPMHIQGPTGVPSFDTEVTQTNLGYPTAATQIHDNPSGTDNLIMPSSYAGDMPGKLSYTNGFDQPLYFPSHSGYGQATHGDFNLFHKQSSFQVQNNDATSASTDHYPVQDQVPNYDPAFISSEYHRIHTDVTTTFPNEMCNGSHSQISPGPGMSSSGYIDVSFTGHEGHQYQRHQDGSMLSLPMSTQPAIETTLSEMTSAPSVLDIPNIALSTETKQRILDLLDTVSFHDVNGSASFGNLRRANQLLDVRQPSLALPTQVPDGAQEIHRPRQESTPISEGSNHNGVPRISSVRYTPYAKPEPQAPESRSVETSQGYYLRHGIRLRNRGPRGK
jgi:hypothetical protein